MGAINCLKFGRERGKFCATSNLIDDEEYSVEIDVSRAIGYRGVQDFKITLKWKRNLNLFIRVRLFNSVSGYFYNRTIVLHNSKQTSMNGSFILNYQNFLLISISNVTECYDLRNNNLSLPFYSSSDPTMVQKVKPKKTIPVVEEKLLELSSDMKNLLQSGYLTDIILTDGTNEIPAHKLILSARSPVFAKMLQHEMKETLENIITITDISINALQKVLNFMYTGVVEITDVEMAINLYMAGDKYDIKDLKEVSARMLMKVDLDNVLQVTILADLYEDKPLKQAAIDFILENFSQVKALESWRHFMTENQALAIEILSSNVVKDCLSEC